MSSPTSVSIIIPCYNRIGTIEAAIESAKADHPGAEVIVIDDGSADGSWDLIKDQEGIRALRIEHFGVSSARNAGLQAATGEYIRFLDSDDLLLPGSTARLLDVAVRAGPSVAPVGRCTEIDYGFPSAANGHLLQRRDLFESALPVGLALFPAAHLKKVGGFDCAMSIGEDQQVALRLAQSGLLFLQTDIEAYSVGRSASNRATNGQDSHVADALVTYVRKLALLAEVEAERVLVGRMAFRFARGSIRQGHEQQSVELLELASQLAGSKARSGPLHVRLAHGVLPPREAESVLLALRRLLRRST